MTYFHASYRPYAQDDRVKVSAKAYPYKDYHENSLTGRTGRVTHITPEECWNEGAWCDAEDCTYYVTFDGETEEFPQAFSYWDLEPVPEDEEKELVPA